MTEATVQRNIRAATLLWMGTMLLSRMMGFLRDIVIARQAGANAETDVYFAAFTLPDFLNYLLAGGALSITFIPIFAGYLAEGRESEGWKVFSTITTFLAVILIPAVLLLMVFTPHLTPLLARGFSLQQHEQLTRLTRILLPTQFFIFEGFLLSAVQMARGKHTLPALAPLIYNGGTILGGIILGPTLGMEAFAWGILAGAVVGNFGLQIYGAHRAGMHFRPRLELRHDGFKRYFRLSLPIMIGQSLVIWDEWLMRYFGSFLSVATISWLNYGRKLAMVPQAIFGQATGYASYPHLARQAAEGKFQELHDTLRGTLRAVLAMALPVQVFLMILAPEICWILFRSDRFTDSDVKATADLLTLFSLGISAWSAQGILARGFYALGDTMTPTVIGTLLTLLSAPLYATLGRHMSHYGLALASVLAMSVYTLVLFFRLEHTLEKRAITQGWAIERTFGPYFFRLLLACVTTYALLLALKIGCVNVTQEGSLLGRLALDAATHLGGTSYVSYWLLALFRCMLIAAIGIPLLVIVSARLGLVEILDFLEKVARRFIGKGRAQRVKRWLLPHRFRSEPQ